MQESYDALSPRYFKTQLCPSCCSTTLLKRPYGVAPLTSFVTDSVKCHFASLHYSIIQNNVTPLFNSPRQTSGQGHELVTSIVSIELWARTLEPLKTRHVGRLVHVKAVEARSRHIHVAWKLGRASLGGGVLS
ncbi:hypothetical protein TNCV_3181831 [Trichonephila clavipes]|nr:hypothetical protein TNCV_3181831 [Trichonephila clavipes]